MGPNTRIAALIVLTALGLVGMFVVDGWMNVIFLIVAIAPLAIGIASFLRISSRQ